MTKLNTLTRIPAGFVWARDYTGRDGGVSHILINGAVSRTNFQARRRAALVESLTLLAVLKASDVLDGCPAAGVGLSDEKRRASYGPAQFKRTPTPEGLVAVALAEVAKSWQDTIDRIDGATVAKVDGSAIVLASYTHLAPGLRRHDETGEVQVTGLFVEKTVVSASTKPPTKSRAKTIVKAFIQQAAGVAQPKFITLRLTPSNFSSVSGGGITLTPADV